MKRNEIYHNDVPLPLRLLGVWGIQGNTLRANWFEASTGWGLALQYQTGNDQHENRRPSLHIRPIYGNFFIKLPWIHFYEPGGYDNKSWGFYWYGSSLWFSWGTKLISFRAPWDWEHCRHEVMLPDGTFAPHVGSWQDEEPDGRRTETHDYTYILRDGTVQNRKATIYVEEREWRWVWFKRFSFPRMIKRSINIEFDDEVGEGSGSWKGGVLGTGENMLPGESPLDTLRRFEATKKFER